MKTAQITPVAAALGALLAMTAMPQAHAQHSPWWERQKDAQAEATAASAAAPQAQSGQQAQSRPEVDTYATRASGSGRASVTRPGYTYIEVGAGGADMGVSGDTTVHGIGGYARGSAAIDDRFYVFGGYDQSSANLGAKFAPLNKETISQAELGLGVHAPVAASVDFIGELSLMRLDQKNSYDSSFDDFSFHLNAGKMMLGFRGKSSPRTEWWVKGGYVSSPCHTIARINEDYSLCARFRSAAGDIGGQFQFTPVWGIVGEAEFYEKLYFYRLGVRASF